MAKRRHGTLLTTLTVDPGLALPLHRQLYLRIRELIAQGELLNGDRLPSSRTLASELHLSRNTVVRAVEQLDAEGFVRSRVGDGTYVSYPAVVGELPPQRPPATAYQAPPEPARPSERGRTIAASPTGRDATEARPFAVGVPALHDFPLKLWRRLWNRTSRELEPDDLGYGHPAGHYRLRKAVTSYLVSARGVQCDPNRVIITSSSQQAIDIASRVLLDPGDEVWLEEPGYLGARGALHSAGAKVIPVPVDEEGLHVGQGIAAAPSARLVYVTPSHQFPTGSVMSLRRRLALLEWAAQTNAWIVEDDYDSEFRYTGRPLAALQGLDRAERVIYVGTLTKVLYPSLRLAYMVVPEFLVETIIAAKSFMDRHSPTFPQLVAADFIEAGHFAAHLRSMRNLYRKRQAALASALAEAPTGRLTPRPDDAGLHLVVDLPDSPAEHRLVTHAAKRHLDVSPLSRYYVGRERRWGLLLGYACASAEELRIGVERLAAGIAQRR